MSTHIDRAKQASELLAKKHDAKIRLQVGALFEVEEVTGNTAMELAVEQLFEFGHSVKKVGEIFAELGKKFEALEKK